MNGRRYRDQLISCKLVVCMLLFVDLPDMSSLHRRRLAAVLCAERCVG